MNKCKSLEVKNAQMPLADISMNSDKALSFDIKMIFENQLRYQRLAKPSY